MQQGDGCTLREHLAAAEKSVGPIARLHSKAPRGSEYVWRWFTELHAARSDRAPISFVDLKAWADVTDTALTPFELDVIRRLDALSMSDPKTWDTDHG